MDVGVGQKNANGDCSKPIQEFEKLNEEVAK
jgi:hypothetical protein